MLNFKSYLSFFTLQNLQLGYILCTLAIVTMYICTVLNIARTLYNAKPPAVRPEDGLFHIHYVHCHTNTHVCVCVTHIQCTACARTSATTVFCCVVSVRSLLAGIVKCLLCIKRDMTMCKITTCMFSVGITFLMFAVSAGKVCDF